MIIAKLVRKKGGPGSGNKGHAGIPGQVGGSMPQDSSGARIPSGYSKDVAYQYAKYILQHKSGEVLPDNLSGIYNNVASVMKPGESYGDWAAETIDKIHIDNLMHDKSGIIESKDKAKFEEIARLNSSKYYPGMPYPYEIVIESDVKTDIEESTLGEWGITSPYQIRPADLVSVGWWEHNNDTWTIHIAKNTEDYGISKREVFWHEFGHTITSDIIEHYIGKPKALELSGEYMDRFAQYMDKH